MIDDDKTYRRALGHVSPRGGSAQSSDVAKRHRSPAGKSERRQHHLVEKSGKGRLEKTKIRMVRRKENTDSRQQRQERMGWDDGRLFFSLTGRVAQQSHTQINWIGELSQQMEAPSVGCLRNLISDSQRIQHPCWTRQSGANLGSMAASVDPKPRRLPGAKVQWTVSWVLSGPTVGCTAARIKTFSAPEHHSAFPRPRPVSSRPDSPSSPSVATCTCQHRLCEPRGNVLRRWIQPFSLRIR